MDHREVAAGPATALDATLGGLLNLQDDLADTVMWLAENWSSDFPVPQAGVRIRHVENGECVACLRLLVHCAAPGQLVAMADLLAGPIVADAGPNQRGRRYQRVTRTFGRVDIEAYTTTEGNAS